MSARADVARLAELCRTRGITIGLAESCTGGLLASWICAYPGASAFFAGGVVSYSRSVKVGVLGVPLSLIQNQGEVSTTVARAMAIGARKSLECTWSVAITGIAGPGGGSVEKPVGTVCFSVVGPAFETVAQHKFAANSGREEIQRQAALFAFDLLVNAI